MYSIIAWRESIISERHEEADGSVSRSVRLC